MRNSTSQYQFASTHRRATSQSLLLLGLVNRGQGRGAARQSYLRPSPLEAQTTILNLAEDRYSFSNPLCINRDSRFVIYLGIVSIFSEVYILSCINTCCTAVSRSPLVHFENGHQHTCLWAKLTHLFPGDSEFGDEDTNSWCDCEADPGASDGSTASGDDAENSLIPPVSEFFNKFHFFDRDISSHSLVPYLFNPTRSVTYYSIIQC
jgi:hypothetical protein